MDDRERGILRKARVVLVKNLSDISGLCDRLLSYGVLTENMVSEVMVKISYMFQNTKKKHLKKTVEVVFSLSQIFTLTNNIFHIFVKRIEIFTKKKKKTLHLLKIVIIHIEFTY